MTARPLIDQATSVPDAIVKVLEGAEIQHVFGMPGGRTGLLFQALYSHPSIRTVLVRHESIGSVMAEVCGRLTGRPGVVMGQGAFMLANAGLGILEAHLGSSPMLVLSDLSDGAPFSQHGPYQAGTGEYGTWDAKRSFEGITKSTFVPQEGNQAVQTTQIAIKHAISGQPGPVAIFYHSAALRSTVDPTARPTLYETSAYLHKAVLSAEPQIVARAVRLLRSAERPVILAGNGVRCSHAYESLRLFAEALDAPVATTAAGKGVISETHPLALGTIGNFGLEAAHEIVADADVILAIGTKLGATDTVNESARLLDPTRQTMIQIDIEPKNAAWTFPIDQVLIGDADVVLRQLLDAIGKSNRGARDRVALAHSKFGSFEVAESVSSEAPLLPQRIIHDLHTCIPDDGFVTCDAGENRIFMNHYFRTKSAGSFLQPAAVGGMGYAIPAALAVKLLHPDRPVVAVCGDGGMAMSTPALFTAVEQNIPIIVLVFNNSALGWVLHGQGTRPIASTFGDFDFAQVASAVGWKAMRVDKADDLAGSLRDAMADGGPVLIDVVTSLRESFTKVTSSLLEAPRVLTPRG
jgi:acetolactate synthase-1/2/3 large subunit